MFKSHPNVWKTGFVFGTNFLMTQVDCMAAGRKKVLVVDDEKNIRDSLQLLLQEHFDVRTAENGEAALDEVGFT